MKLGVFGDQTTPDFQDMVGAVLLRTCGEEDTARSSNLYKSLSKPVISAWKRAEKRTKNQNDELLERLIKLYNIRTDIVIGQKDKN